MGVKGICVERRVVIAAPPERIWSVLLDVDRWARWNPLYPHARGSLRVGEVIEIGVSLGGGKPRRVRGEVVDVAEQCRFRFVTTPLGGLMRTEREVRIEPTGSGRSMIVNRECFSGLLGGTIARATGKAIGEGFEAMNGALRRVAEAAPAAGAA